MKKGGAAKGELVLAIFELANCFRHGGGVAKDPVAARQYYETAANLGDTDAMNEAAWCFLEGFGGKKNKVGSCTFSYLVPLDHCKLDVLGLMAGDVTSILLLSIIVLLKKMAVRLWEIVGMSLRVPFPPLLLMIRVHDENFIVCADSFLRCRIWKDKYNPK